MTGFKTHNLNSLEFVNVQGHLSSFLYTSDFKRIQFQTHMETAITFEDAFKHKY